MGKISYKKRAKIYSDALNEMDDYFEYRYKSKEDRDFVIDTLDNVTDKLHKLLGEEVL